MNLGGLAVFTAPETRSGELPWVPLSLLLLVSLLESLILLACVAIDFTVLAVIPLIALRAPVLRAS